MFKHILIPTDGSELSERAIRSGIAFAKSVGARVTAITCSPPYHVVAIEPLMVTDTRERYLADTERRGRQFLEVAEATARTAGVRCETVHTFSDQPHQAIIETAQARDCDAILMASHGRRGMSAVLLGSETQKVLTHCKIPVIVWR